MSHRGSWQHIRGGVSTMRIRKQSISKLELGVLCSLSDSYMMLPFLILSF